MKMETKEAEEKRNTINTKEGCKKELRAISLPRLEPALRRPFRYPSHKYKIHILVK